MPAAHLLNSTKKELETEKGKVAQLKRDMEGLKRKSKAEQEKAARLVYIHPSFRVTLITSMFSQLHETILYTEYCHWLCFLRQRVRELLWKER